MNEGHRPSTGASGLPEGLVDLHSHLLPAMDDGCENLDESLACIARLKDAGFIGTICTPHLNTPEYPDNTPARVVARVDQLRYELRQAGVNYHVWAGGELRIDKHVVSWMQRHGIPTLAGSNRVLADFWDKQWKRWAPGVFRWLIDAGYQPILAHPERLPAGGDLAEDLRILESLGVWLQGNARSMTGEEGPRADQVIRRLLIEDRYQFMALDMHGFESLEGRLDGLMLLEREMGRDVLERLLGEAPRKMILQTAGETRS